MTAQVTVASKEAPMKKFVKRLLSAILCLSLVLGPCAYEVYAFSCVWSTCGCKDRGIEGCSNSNTCWYGDGDGCSGHSWYLYSESSASCTEGGCTIYNCSRCPGQRIYSTPALGHDFGSWGQCDSKQHSRTCSRCGLEQKENHTLGSWTSTGDGKHSRMCTVCGYNQNKSLSISNVSSNWTGGDVVVSVSGSDNGDGCRSVEIYRVNCITGVESRVASYNRNGANGDYNYQYIQSGEGIFYFYAIATDEGGHTCRVQTDWAYIDKSGPMIYGLESVRSDWTNEPPMISARATDYLYGTSTQGSGVSRICIYDDYGRQVSSGHDSVTFILDNSYEGEHTFRVEASDNVGHVTTRNATTRFDVTPPGVEGNEITYVTSDGVTISGYCQDNIIRQHADDEAYRSHNGANRSSGIKSVILYGFNGSREVAIHSSTTYKQFGYSDTHSSFDVYYDVSGIDPCDYYTIVVEDFAGNRVKKKLTCQKSLIDQFHTSIDRGSY